MPPIKEFLCLDCGHEYEDIVAYYDDNPPCPHCESTKIEKLVSITGGYHMNSGPSSVRPKGAGSRPRKAK